MESSRGSILASLPVLLILVPVDGRIMDILGSIFTVLPWMQHNTGTHMHQAMEVLQQHEVTVTVPQSDYV